MRTNPTKNTLNWQRYTLSSSHALTASVSGSIRVIPEVAAAALSRKDHGATFTAFRLWNLLWKLEGAHPHGLHSLPILKSRLSQIKPSENWDRVLRSAKKLTFKDADGLTCGFVSVFKGRNGQMYLRRHGIGAVIRFLGIKTLSRAVTVPASDFCSTVSHLKRILSIAFITRPIQHKKSKVVLPESQSQVAKKLGCHRNTIGRRLRKGTVKPKQTERPMRRVANFEIVSSGIGVAQQFKSYERARYQRNHLNIRTAFAVIRAQKPELSVREALKLAHAQTIDGRRGSYQVVSSNDTTTLPVEVTSRFPVVCWLLIRRLPSTVVDRPYQPVSYRYHARLAKLHNILMATPYSASRTCEGAGDVYQFATGNVYDFRTCSKQAYAFFMQGIVEPCFNQSMHCND